MHDPCREEAKRNERLVIRDWPGHIYLKEGGRSMLGLQDSLLPLPLKNTTAAT
ncbi:hypothetical protein Plhal304r1_c003g0013881 [Plasmopara halstedii]